MNRNQSLLATDGNPEAGIRYWWRYWDNNMNVYEVSMEKFRDGAGTTAYNYINLIDASINYRSLLREATEIGGMASGGDNIYGCDFLLVSFFITRGNSFIAVQHESYFGTLVFIIIETCDAGNEGQKEYNSCSNHVEHVLQQCSRCKLVFYCNNGYCQKEDWWRHSKICKYFK